MIVSPEIETYAHAHSEPADALRMDLIDATKTGTAMPQMQSGQVEGLLLKFLVASLNARLVVEIGTFTGYSALMMAEGLAPGGKVITCDIDPEATAIAREYWAEHHAGDRIELRLGPALDTLASIDGPVDFAFIDADKGGYIAYWEALIPKMRQGGLIAVDNVLWSGKVLDPKDDSDRAIVAFNTHAAADARVEKVMLTVRDGILLARVL